MQLLISCTVMGALRVSLLSSVNCMFKFMSSASCNSSLELVLKQLKGFLNLVQHHNYFFRIVFRQFQYVFGLLLLIFLNLLSFLLFKEFRCLFIVCLYILLFYFSFSIFYYLQIQEIYLILSDIPARISRCVVQVSCNNHEGRMA